MFEELKFLISSCRFFNSCIKSECFKSGMDLVLLFLSDFLLLWFCWFGMWSSSYSRKFMMMTKAVPNCRAISQRCAFTIWTMANCRRLIKMSIDQKKMILLLSNLTATEMPPPQKNYFSNVYLMMAMVDETIQVEMHFHIEGGWGHTFA